MYIDAHKKLTPIQRSAISKAPTINSKWGISKSMLREKDCHLSVYILCTT